MGDAIEKGEGRGGLKRERVKKKRKKNGNVA